MRTSFPLSFREFLDRLFGVDLRALALMRVVVASIVLYDLAVRARHLHEHYGSLGVFPREVWQAFWAPFGYWSIHFLVPDPLWIIVLFIASGVSAFCLLIGYRTRLATVLLWVLTISLHNANPLILTGGDTTLRLVLFLGIFLPWQRAFAVDTSLLDERTSWRVTTPWTAAYLLQIACIYVFAGFAKLGITWQTGTAVYYALSIDYLRTAIGDITYRFPVVMQVIAVSVLTLQKSSFFLLFSPLYTTIARTVVTPLLMGMHLGFGVHLTLGIFSWISIAALIPFLPTEFFDSIRRALLRFGFGSITIYYDDKCLFCRKSVYLLRTFLLLPNTQVRPAQMSASALARMREKDSWIIKDANGAYFYTYSAGIRALKASPLFFPLAVVLNNPVFTPIGEYVYRCIARNRKHIPLPDNRPSTANLSAFIKVGTYLGAFTYIIAVASWNLSSSWHSPQDLRNIVRQHESVYHSVGLAQWWDVFAPNPLSNDGWVIPKVTLEDGRTFNALYPDRPFSLERPGRLSDYYPDWRTRKYFSNITRQRYAFYPQFYASSLCARPDMFTSPPESVELIYIKENSLPDYQIRTEKIILSKVFCK